VNTYEIVNTEMQCDRALVCFEVFAVLSGCAGKTNSYREEYAAYHDTLVSRWGPENTWSPERRAAYLQGLRDIHEENLTRIGSSPSPSYHPPLYQQLPKYQPVALNGRFKSSQTAEEGTRRGALTAARNRYSPMDMVATRSGR
jgi:hypothetical protein